jgi:hypothetical protein
MLNIQNKYANRYKEVRAPYRKLNKKEPAFLLIKDEKKARKMPDY